MVESYEEALAFIHGRQQLKSQTLDRMTDFLSRLGNPQQQFSAIHIAGTNGKGSTLTFLSALLQAHGLTVGTYTSPFLMRFNERISVDNQPISDDDLLALVQQVEPIVAAMDATDQGGPSEFEVVTGMMDLYFAQHPVDAVLVEVGIGGLLDSTNVIRSEMAVITTIGMDHMALLGNTIPEIAAQKAGIIKPTTSVVVGQVADDAYTVIEAQANEAQTPIVRFGADFAVKKRTGQGWQERFDYDFDQWHFKNLKIAMIGDYQIENAATALAAFLTYAQTHQIQVEVNRIKKGLLSAFWAGRLEVMNQEPLVVLDGAHNEPAVTQLAQTIRQHFGRQQVTILFAVLADKQFEKMIATLAALPDVSVVLTSFEGVSHRRAASKDELTTLAAQFKNVTVQPVWQTALGNVAGALASDDVLMITGSLYFVSDVRHFFLDQD